MSWDETTWALERQDGELGWGGCGLSDVAREFGTPTYVVNAERLAAGFEALRTPFDEAGLDARVFFSVKTNPVPAVLSRIAGLGCGAEVISPFEYWLASRLGFTGDRVVVNGTWKGRSLLAQAVGDGAAMINVESLEELRLLQEVAAEGDRRARIGLRINPCLRTSRFDFTLSTGSPAGHAGFRRHDREWGEAIRLVREDPRLELRGLHFHIGSGVRSAQPYEASTKAALEMWSDLLDAGLSPTVLDIGGGFAAETLKEFNLFEAVRFFGWKRPPGLSRAGGGDSLPREVARACGTAIRSHARDRGLPLPTLFLEPGRALVASSQLLLLSVLTVRARPGRLPVAVCDAGAMSLSPLLLSERHTILTVSRPQAGPLACYDVMGNLPTPLDIVALRQPLPTLARGDVIAVMDVGAYFTALGNNFAGPRLPVVLIEGGVARLVRERETFAGMVMRDLDGVSGAARLGTLPEPPQPAHVGPRFEWRSRSG